ncbi:uncharacterized protein LOC124936570 [Impatiens glandulifera]|uniref:uncharacterized protein LOC124936570 n=1 Tax=Impatiens glandulifera TaxID=253017 RepID=UPI001FB15F0F|nr:uncharacterized protein LOC124936570 [Impatiens glandulifera]
MKRKGDEDITEDFPLSPAIKIRRLDENLPTMIPDDELLDNIVSNRDPVEIPEEVMALTELNNPILENDERAIVLFKPLNTQSLYQSPSSFRVSIDPDFLSEIKYNRFMSSSQSHMKRPEEKDEVYEHDTNQCLAVVPWIPSTLVHHHLDKVEVSELMMEEDEQMGEESLMDVDEESSINGVVGQMEMNENLQWQQQQQQQCMIQQSSNSSPVVWFR